MHTIAVLSGDGIGPEIMDQALKVLSRIKEKFDFDYYINEALIGGAAIDKTGSALPDETLRICEDSDVILFGAVGGPKWESLPPEQQPERGALLPLRKHFDLFANLRPCKVFKPLLSSCPLKDSIVGNGFDFLVVRELTGGIYFGSPKGRDGSGDQEKAYDTLIYHKSEIERIAHIAFKAAMSRNKTLTSIDKANVLISMVFWREVVSQVAKEYPDVKVSNMYVDAATMKLISDPGSLDVLLCPNMFGDILSDEGAMMTGSLGMLPSASLNQQSFGLYEPAGGSAPDIAGKGIANPIAQILCVKMMFKYTFMRNDIASAVDNAVEKALEKGLRTKDIHTPGTTLVSTNEIGDEIANLI